MQEYQYILKIRFEWDDAKNRSNFEKHGISFEEAVLAFYDLAGMEFEDAKHSSESEIRFWRIGDCGFRIAVVVFVQKENGALYRIISARPANKKERGLYEKNKG